MYKQLCLSLVLVMSAACVNVFTKSDVFTGPQEVRSYQPGMPPHSFSYTYRVGDTDKFETKSLTVKDVRRETCAKIMFELLKLRHRPLDQKEQEAMERLSEVYERLKCFDLENDVVPEKVSQK